MKLLSTSVEDKVSRGQDELSDGISLWRRVSLEWDIPYFLLRFELQEDGQWTPYTYIFGTLGSLIEACRPLHGSDAIQVIQVALIVPPCVKKASGWSMHDLDEIKATPIDHQGNFVGHFKTKTGQEFTDSFSTTPMTEQFISQLAVVFRRDWFPSIL